MLNSSLKGSLESLRVTTTRKMSDLTNCVSLCIGCPNDNTLLIVADEIDIWVPNITFQGQTSIQTVLQNEIKEIAGFPVNIDRIIRINKLWVPHHPQSYLYHFVIEIKCNVDQKKRMKLVGGKYKSKLKWVNEQELVKLATVSQLLSPELVDYLNMIRNKQVMIPPEIFVCGNVYELSDTVLISSNNHMYDEIVKAADLGLDTQKELLSHFFLISYPAYYLSRPGFTKLLSLCGHSRSDIPHIFRAANLSGTGGLSFKELLYVLAALEPKTTHGGLAAEIRCRYIFRFFDQDNDNVLSVDEFKNLVVNMRKTKGLTMDTASIQSDIESYYKSFGFSTEGKPLGMADFLHSVGDLKLRGTSMIFRSADSIKTILNKCKANLGNPNSFAGGQDKAMQMKKRKSEDIKLYEIAMHSMKLQKNGTVLTVEPVMNVEGAISLTTIKSYSLVEGKRKPSIEVFSQKSLANDTLKTLRIIASNNKSSQIFSWGIVQPQSFGQNIIHISKQVKDLMMEEPRLVDVTSPCYIMGDFHGNINDMLNFEKTFWPLGPNLCPANLLFLGDYVDRGAFGLEVIIYLFCYKVQTPHKITLIRGNHEIREIQKLFTFFTECNSKFGEKLGLEVWTAINNAFDVMPLAAIVDGKLFCCHGGIPPPWLCPAVNAINHIPCPLTKPDDQSALAWALMWNDPIKAKQINDLVNMELLANEGFAVNQRRGTAHVFNSDALDRFLNINNFTHLIRGHESAQAGFYFQQKGKALTIFSASNYCRGTNEAACILVDQSKLRVFRLEN